jgi:hypothetical protein
MLEIVRIATAHRKSSSDGFVSASVIVSFPQQPHFDCAFSFTGGDLRLPFFLRGPEQKVARLAGGFAIARFLAHGGMGNVVR